MTEKFTREELLEKLEEYDFIDESGFKLQGYENDKEIILLAVGADSEEDMLQYVSKELFSDVDFLLELIDVKNEALTYAPDELKKDKDFILKLIKKNPFIIEFVPEDIIDKEMAIYVMETFNEIDEHIYQTPFEYLPEKFRSDREIVDLAMQKNVFAIRKVTEPLISDRNFIIDVLTSGKDASYIAFTETKVEAFKADKELVLIALQHAGKYCIPDIYAVISQELKDDKELIPMFLKNTELFVDLPDELKEDKEFLLPCVKQNPELFNELNDELRFDKDIAQIASDIQNVKYINFELLFGGYKTRELAISACKFKGENLQYFEKFNDDKEVVISAMQTSNEAFQYASDELKGDAEFLISAVTEHNGRLCLSYVNSELFGNDDFVKMAVKHSIMTENWESAYSLAVEHIRDNEEVALIAVTSGFEDETQYLSERLKADRNFLLKVSKYEHFQIDISELPLQILDDKEVMIAMFHSYTENSLEYVSDRLRADYDVVLEAVKVNGENYEVIGSAELKGKPEIILEAIKTYPEVYKALKETGNDTKENIIKAVSNNYEVLNYIYPEIDVTDLWDTEEIYNEDDFDIDIVLPAIKQNDAIFKLFPEKFKSDRNIVIKAVEQNAQCIEYVPKKFYSDREIMLEAVSHYDEAYRLCPQEFQDDVEFGLKALEAEELYGTDYKEPKRLAIRYFSNKLRDDEEIALKFLEYDVFTSEHLWYLSERLKSDRKIVMTAVKKYGGNIQFADKKYLEDYEIVKEAVSSSIFTFLYIPEKYRTNEELLEIARNKYLEAKNEGSAHHLRDIYDCLSTILPPEIFE